MYATVVFVVVVVMYLPVPVMRYSSLRCCISWLHQICTDLNLLSSDSFNLALDWTSWWAVI